MKVQDLAARIDHTLLKAQATAAQVEAICQEARDWGFAAVCVNPVFIRRARAALAGSSVRACTVIGFPLGAATPLAKAREAADAIDHGAQELDIVAHLPPLLAADYEQIHGELVEVITAVHNARTDILVKVIVESALLAHNVSEAQAEQRIATACKAIHDAGGDFIKTSTGFHPAGGATEAAVQWMRRHARGLKIKASGGIQTREQAMRLLAAGADRLGCSASVQIVGGCG